MLGAFGSIWIIVSSVLGPKTPPTVENNIPTSRVRRYEPGHHESGLRKRFDKKLLSLTPGCACGFSVAKHKKTTTPCSAETGLTVLFSYLTATGASFTYNSHKSQLTQHSEHGTVVCVL